MTDEGPPKSEETPAPAPVVLRLRGLPFAASDEDIKAFFGQYELETVFICKRNGRATGEAFVKLAQEEKTVEASKALNRQNIGHRYVEIFDATEADLNTAKAISNDNRMKGYVVRLRGLPYSSTASDVVKFFDQVEMCRGLDGVVFTYMPDGRPTGEAFVEFPSEEAQREAMKKHKNLVGTRYIELFVSTKSDMLQAIQQNKYLLGYANRRRWVPNNMPMQGHMGYNHDMRGAPMHQHGHMQFAPGGMEDMNELFRGFNIGPGMQMVNGGGRATAIDPVTGAAYVQVGNIKQQYPGGPAVFSAQGGMLNGGHGVQQVMQQVGPAAPGGPAMVATLQPQQQQLGQALVTTTNEYGQSQTVVVQQQPVQAGSYILQQQPQVTVQQQAPPPGTIYSMQPQPAPPVQQPQAGSNPWAVKANGAMAVASAPQVGMQQVQLVTAGSAELASQGVGAGPGGVGGTTNTWLLQTTNGQASSGPGVGTTYQILSSDAAGNATLMTTTSLGSHTMAPHHHGGSHSSPYMSPAYSANLDQLLPQPGSQGTITVDLPQMARDMAQAAAQAGGGGQQAAASVAEVAAGLVAQ